MPLLGVMSHCIGMWPKGWHSTSLGHQMSLPGGYIWLNLLYNCFDWKCHAYIIQFCSWPCAGSAGGYIWANVSRFIFLVWLLLLLCHFVVVVHPSLWIHNYRWITTTLHSNNYKNNKKNKNKKINLHKLLNLFVLVVVVTMSFCCCCCAWVIVYPQLQMQKNKNNIKQ